MASAGYGPVNSGKVTRDDEDGLVDEWGVRYEGHHKPGGGTFGRHRRSRRRYLYMAAGAIVLFLVIVIIVVAVQKHGAPQQVPAHQLSFPRWQNNSKEGVTMYPIPSDGTVLIKYYSRDTGAKGPNHYISSLEHVLHDYQMVNEMDSKYVTCTRGNNSADKVCKFDPSVFKSCGKKFAYGYPVGTPCVLLQLNLPRNETAIPFTNQSDVAKNLGDRYDPDYIGVTCQGETEDDQAHFTYDGAKGPPVEYFPKQGFPAYWFRPRTIDEFLPPVVMVKFNTLRDGTYVRIKCTAWGKSFNNGRPDNSSIYSTSFVIFHI